MRPFEYGLMAVIGSLSFFIVIVAVNENSNKINTQDYDHKYVHLISRNVDAVISKSTKFDPSRTCFEITDTDYQIHFSKQFADSLIKASRVDDSLYDPQYGVGFQLNGVSFEMSPQEAIGYLTKYDFKEEIIELQGKRDNKQPDIATSKIHYDCFFDYKGEQYLFQLNFDPMIPLYEKFNQINITKNEQGQPVLVNADIVAYLDFNDTTVFNNQLDEDVTLVFPIVKPKKDGYSSDNITIPAHMSFTYYFRNYYAGGKIPYVYTIQPLGLYGSVLVKNPAHYCMSMDEARSVYSHKGIGIRYPSYLPDGYKYGCTAMVTTREVLIGYDKSGILADDMEFLTNYKKRVEYLQKGGIVIDFYLMNDAKRDCENELESAEPIGDGITVYADSSKFEGATANSLRLCTDNEVYNIGGQLLKDELIKMMKSVYEK